MAHQFLKELYDSSEFKPKVLQRVSEALTPTRQKLSQKMKGKELLYKSFEELQDRLKLNRNPADIETNVRKSKLQEAKRTKEELQAKLSQVTSSIEILDSLSPERSTKANLQNKTIRKAYYEEQQKAAEEARNKVKDYHQEQKQRQKKIKKHSEMLKKLEQEDKEMEQKLREQKEKQKEEEYKTYLQKTSEKSQKRKEQIENLKHKIKKQKGLLTQVQKEQAEKKIQEKLKQKAEEENKVKYSQDYIEKVSEHAKWYDSIKQDQERRRQQETRNKYIDSAVESVSSKLHSSSRNILLRDKKFQEEKEKANQERLRLVQKRAQYSGIVKEMFTPHVDLKKKQEIQKRIDKLDNSAKIHKKQLSPNSPKPEGPLSKIWSNNTWKPKKIPENSLAPRPKPKRQPKKVDYLNDIKKVREEQVEKMLTDEPQISSYSTETDNPEKLKEKAQNLEKQALKKEKLLNFAKSQNLKKLEHSYSVDHMIIGSIRNKLAILEQATRA